MLSTSARALVLDQARVLELYQARALELMARSLGGTIPKTNEIVKNICSCHNFFSLSSVQIIIIPACCLLCVL